MGPIAGVQAQSQVLIATGFGNFDEICRPIGLVQAAQLGFVVKHIHIFP